MLNVIMNQTFQSLPINNLLMAAKIFKTAIENFQTKINVIALLTFAIRGR
jgi:hypothetical protein